MAPAEKGRGDAPGFGDATGSFKRWITSAMGKQGKLRRQAQHAAAKRVVRSLLDEMEDGREYASLIDLAVAPGAFNPRDEIRRAIREVEDVRGRPLLCYLANIVKPLPGATTSIDVSDDLPFSEMVAAVPANHAAIDMIVVTPGGFAQQVSQLVDRTRSRFQQVEFILPHMAMSAGTIWVLSGNEIWMDSRAMLGPIDPQVPGKDGRLLPAQALLALLQEIQQRAQANLSRGQQPDWAHVQILRNIDPKELGNALTMTRYSIQLASSYLEAHKFRDWTTHSSNGQTVTPDERKARAIEIATQLASHEVWKMHSHGISRDVALRELRLKIQHPENVPGLERAVRRLWALVYWIFENSLVSKTFLSQTYSLFRLQPGGANR